MRLWEENRRLLTGAGIALLAVLAALFTIALPVGSAIEQDAQVYRTLSEKLEQARRGPCEVAEAVESLRAASDALERELAELKKRVEIPFQDWTSIPASYARDPGAYFALKHAQVRDELYIECQKAEPRVRLSDDYLGFRKILEGGILDNKQAQENLNRLSIVRRLVLLLVESRVTEIVSISPGEPVKTGAKDYTPFIIEYPVQIAVKTRLDPLMKFLHAVRRPGEFFLVVRGLQVRGRDPRSKDAAGSVQAADDGELDAVVSAAGMRFIAEADRQPARPVESRPAGTGPPAGRPLGY